MELSSRIGWNDWKRKLDFHGQTLPLSCAFRFIGSKLPPYGFIKSCRRILRKIKVVSIESTMTFGFIYRVRGKVVLVGMAITYQTWTIKLKSIKSNDPCVISTYFWFDVEFLYSRQPCIVCRFERSFLHSASTSFFCQWNSGIEAVTPIQVFLSPIKANVPNWVSTETREKLPISC